MKARPDTSFETGYVSESGPWCEGRNARVKFKEQFGKLAMLGLYGLGAMVTCRAVEVLVPQMVIALGHIK